MACTLAGRQHGFSTVQDRPSALGALIAEMSVGAGITSAAYISLLAMTRTT